VVAALRRAFAGAEVTMTSGGRGEFTVWRDGQKIVDTSKTGEFPTDDDVLTAARS
jgi:hypothetical protein